MWTIPSHYSQKPEIDSKPISKKSLSIMPVHCLTFDCISKEEEMLCIHNESRKFHFHFKLSKYNEAREVTYIMLIDAANSKHISTVYCRRNFLYVTGEIELCRVLAPNLHNSVDLWAFVAFQHTHDTWIPEKITDVIHHRP